MAELILHHFDLSPFAEKARLMLGLKGLAWYSVEIPMILPKPDLTALTGGYRKTPVLQIGAEVICDTRLIALELERRHPQPTLFPGGNRGLARMLAAWSDRAFFEPGAGLSMGLNRLGLPAALIEDRKRFFNFMDFDRLEQALPHLAVQFRAHAGLIEEQLADGRRFLLGDAPGLADIHAYFPVWMARAHVPTAEALLGPLGHLPAWESRLRAIGHGHRSALDPARALEVARTARPEPGTGVSTGEPFEAGQVVVVAADDYGADPVSGRLMTLTEERIVIERRDARAGAVHVHFPRIGYRLERAGANGED